MQQEGKHIALFWEDHIPAFLRPFPSLEKNHLICLGVCGFPVKEHFSLVLPKAQRLWWDLQLLGLWCKFLVNNKNVFL